MNTINTNMSSNKTKSVNNLDEYKSKIRTLENIIKKEFDINPGRIYIFL